MGPEGQDPLLHWENKLFYRRKRMVTEFIRKSLDSFIGFIVSITVDVVLRTDKGVLYGAGTMALLSFINILCNFEQSASVIKK